MKPHLSSDGQYRWRLYREWNRDLPMVCWIMLNPSTADAERDDPTVRRCIGFSTYWGYGSMTVVNLYPLRTSSPRHCRDFAAICLDAPYWDLRDLMMKNEAWVQREAKASALVVAAWGAEPYRWDGGQWAEHIVEAVTSDVEPFLQLHVLGLTASGAPKHPLARGRHRIPDHQEPILWDGGLL